uniref:Uncharacterized protein n=1 Tax=Siphoviridae sp. ctXZx16 TaxID=2826371 RepID=A0A8S5ML40_9CAUD|nr:MAG TPA: protein of unknown function (DUF5596) [Siphoviridae sp. ctXZx16]
MNYPRAKANGISDEIFKGTLYIFTMYLINFN